MLQKTSEQAGFPAADPAAGAQKGTNGFVPFAKRVLATSTILVILASVTALFMGLSSLSVNREIKDHEYFISVAKEVQPNFEDSLTLYTGETRKIIDFLLSLRPDSEEDYITFITALENLGNSLSLNLDVSSVESSVDPSKTAVEPSNSLEYEIRFYGSFKNLQAFIEGFDVLPYYVKILSIKYTNPSSLEDDKDRKLPNVTVRIELYIK